MQNRTRALVLAAYKDSEDDSFADNWQKQAPIVWCVCSQGVNTAGLYPLPVQYMVTLCASCAVGGSIHQRVVICQFNQ